MKALFITADLGGNTPPTLAVAQDLARRGVVVEIAGLETVPSQLRHVPFPLAAAVSGTQAPKGLRKSRALLTLIASRAAARAAAELVAARRPNVVIADCMTLAPFRGALAAGAPVAGLFHTLGSYWAGSFDRGPVGRALSAFGLRPRSLWERASARLMLTDPHLDPSSSDPTMREYTWLGTTETGGAPGPRALRPRVLVTLGTTDWPGVRASISASSACSHSCLLMRWSQPGVSTYAGPSGC